MIRWSPWTRCPTQPSRSCEITDVEKRYQALRPLRLQALTIAPGERVAIVGLDAAAAEVLVNLVTGASVADRGTVRVPGRGTTPTSPTATSGSRRSIASGSSARARCCSKAATLEQNLAMPFTLQIDPVAPDIAERVVVARQRVWAECQNRRRNRRCRSGSVVWQGSVHPR